jgi:hypothetical protein
MFIISQWFLQVVKAVFEQLGEVFALGDVRDYIIPPFFGKF